MSGDMYKVFDIPLSGLPCTSAPVTDHDLERDRQSIRLKDSTSENKSEPNQNTTRTPCSALTLDVDHTFNCCGKPHDPDIDVPGL